MKRIYGSVLVVVFLGTLPLWACGSKGNENDKGKALYKDKCQICHGVAGDGNGPAAQSLMMPPADFTDPEFWQDGVEKMIAFTIVNGKGVMPAFDLKPDEVQSIIRFMSRSFNKAAQNQR